MPKPPMPEDQLKKNKTHKFSPEHIEYLKKIYKAGAYLGRLIDEDIGEGTLVHGAYQLENGAWQHASFEGVVEAVHTLEYHAQGRPWVISNNMSLLPPED